MCCNSNNCNSNNQNKNDEGNGLGLIGNLGIGLAGGAVATMVCGLIYVGMGVLSGNVEIKIKGR